MLQALDSFCSDRERLAMAADELHDCSELFDFLLVELIPWIELYEADGNAEPQILKADFLKLLESEESFTLKERCELPHRIRAIELPRGVPA